MIGLSKGQEIFESFKVQSKMGSGVMYLLNTGIAFEISGRGLALELNYDEIISVKEIKETLLISWKESTETYDIRFNLKNASDVAQKIVRYQNEKLAR